MSWPEAFPREEQFVGFAGMKAAVHWAGDELLQLALAARADVVARDAVIVTVANVDTYGAWLKLTPTASPIGASLNSTAKRKTGKGSSSGVSSAMGSSHK